MCRRQWHAGSTYVAQDDTIAGRDSREQRPVRIIPRLGQRPEEQRGVEVEYFLLHGREREARDVLADVIALHTHSLAPLVLLLLDIVG